MSGESDPTPGDENPDPPSGDGEPHSTPGDGQRDPTPGERPDPTPGERGQRSRTPSSDSPWRALGAALGLGAAGVVLSFVVILSVALGLDAAGVTLPVVVSILLTLLLNQYLCFGGTAIAYARYRGRDPVEYFKVRTPSARDLGVVILGVIVAFGIVFVASILIQILGLTAAENEAATEAVENPELFAVLIPASILVIGPGEELLFRGAVQRRLRETFGPAVSITVASGMFAAVHVVALSGPSVQAFLTTISILLFPALVFGVAYEYTANIVVSSLIHGLYDAILFSLLYVVTVYGPEQGSQGSSVLLPALL